MRISLSQRYGRMNHGTSYLQNDPRSRIQWSIRAIPIDLVRCWSRYEDATELTAPETKPEEPTVQAQALPEVSKPVANRIQTKLANVTPMPQQNPAPSMLRPLVDLTVNRKRAFMGNCAAPESAYITDGRILFLKAACEPRFAQQKTVAVGNYGPASPV